MRKKKFGKKSLICSFFSICISGRKRKRSNCTSSYSFRTRIITVATANCAVKQEEVSFVFFFLLTFTSVTGRKRKQRKTMVMVKGNGKMLTHCRLCAVSHRPQNQLSSVRFRTLSPVPSPPPTDGVDSFLRCRLLRHCSNSRCYRCRSLRSYSRCYCSSRCHRRHRRYQCYCCYCCCCNCRCPPSVGF